MAYYTTISMFVAGGFLAFIAILGGIMASYAVYALYMRLEELSEPVRSFLHALRPAYETLQSRMHVLTHEIAARGLRPRS